MRGDMPEIEIVSTTPFVSVSKDRKLETIAFVVYKTKDGRVGAVTVDKTMPTPSDVEAAIKAREARR